MPALAATSRRASPPPKALAARRKLASERLEIEIRLGPDYARIAAIDAELKKHATDAGESFKEDFGAKGHVSVSGAVAAEMKGEIPQIVAEAYLALPAAERKKLVKSGVVVIEENWGRASNGKVTVKVL